MKALTVWQAWASLIAIGAKPYEFRGWDYRTRARGIVGKRIAIHAGARPMVMGEIADILGRLNDGTSALVHDLALPLLQRLAGMTKAELWSALPRSAVVATAIIGDPLKATKLFAGMIDSDRLDHAIWAWPLTDVVKLEPEVPWRGAQGFWEFPDRTFGAIG